jgi:hypothetical protein
VDQFRESPSLKNVGGFSPGARRSSTILLRQRVARLTPSSSGTSSSAKPIVVGVRRCVPAHHAVSSCVVNVSRKSSKSSSSHSSSHHAVFNRRENSCLHATEKEEKEDSTGDTLSSVRRRRPVALARHFSVRGVKQNASSVSEERCAGQGGLPVYDSSRHEAAKCTLVSVGFAAMYSSISDSTWGQMQRVQSRQQLECDRRPVDLTDIEQRERLALAQARMIEHQLRVLISLSHDELLDRTTGESILRLAVL